MIEARIWNHDEAFEIADAANGSQDKALNEQFIGLTKSQLYQKCLDQEAVIAFLMDEIDELLNEREAERALKTSDSNSSDLTAEDLEK